jgi:RNA polymerase sigma factor (sigma-70 family)
MCEGNIIGQLKEGHPCAFDLLYRTYYPVIEKFILTNSGSQDDAKDIFQETLLIFNRNLARENFTLTSSLKTYLYSISKNLWLKSLRGRKVLSPLISAEQDFPDLSITVQQENETAEKLTHYMDNLIARMPVHCQKIVHYVYYDNVPVEEIAEKMGYNSTHTASNVKYKCLQQMKKASGSIE